MNHFSPAWLAAGRPSTPRRIGAMKNLFRKKLFEKKTTPKRDPNAAIADFNSKISTAIAEALSAGGSIHRVGDALENAAATTRTRAAMR
jgi:hypothetical protein